MPIKSKQSLAQCPFCNSHEIDYGSLELEGMETYYPAECRECKKSFKEHYVLKYIETTYDCCDGCQSAPINIDDLNKPCDVCQDDEYEQAEQEHSN